MKNLIRKVVGFVSVAVLFNVVGASLAFSAIKSDIVNDNEAQVELLRVVNDDREQTKLLHTVTRACLDGVVKKLLQNNPALVNTTFEPDEIPSPIKGYTPLMLSIKCKSEATMMAILNTPGVEIDFTTDYTLFKATALILAARADDLSKVQILLSRGADVRARTIDGGMFDNFGLTALNEAVQNANLPMIKTLVQAGADVNDPEYPPIESIASVREAQLANKVVNLLAELGVDLTIQTPQVFLESMYNVNINAIRALLSAQVLANDAMPYLGFAFYHKVLDFMDTVPYSYSESREQYRYSQDSINDFNELVQKNIQMAKLLLAHGANINATDNGHMILSYLTTFEFSNRTTNLIDAGVEKLITFLIDEGANPNFINRHGNSLVHTEGGLSLRLMRHLLQYMSPEAVNAQEKYNGDTAVMMLMKHPHWYRLPNKTYLLTIEAFLKAGYRVDIKNRWGHTALNWLRWRLPQPDNYEKQIIKSITDLFDKYR